MELVFGMKDVHPQELKIKRHIEYLLRTMFEEWGYEEVDTPTLEYHSTLQPVLGKDQMEHVFQFVSRSGKLLCLRPEFTTSIARMYSRKVAEKFIPARIFYSGKIFRLPSSSLRSETELTQVGCEHIGNTGPAADVEMIAMTLSALQRLGIQEFVLDIGHVGFIRGIIDSLELGEVSREVLYTSLRRRDFHSVKRWIETVPPTQSREARLLAEIPFLRGGIDLLERYRHMFPASGNFQQAVQSILQVFTRLRDLQLDGEVFLNLGLTRDYEYYTGLILEGFSPRVGYPIVVGGRYDGLFRLFGKDYPACGFVFFTERLVEVLQKTGSLPTEFPEPLVIHHPPDRCSDIFSLARSLRQRGVPVITEEQVDSEEVTFTCGETVLSVSQCDPDLVCRIWQGEKHD